MPKYLLFWWKEEGKASKKKKFDSFQYIAFRPKVKASAFFLWRKKELAERKEREKSVCIFVISNMLLLLRQMMIEKTLAL